MKSLARKPCRRECGGAGRDSLPARDTFNLKRVPAKRDVSWGVASA